MDLSRTNDPKRILKWNGKSIATCSRTELVNCVIHLSGQIVQAGKKLEEAKSAVPALPAELMDLIERHNERERQIKDLGAAPAFDMSMMFPVFCIVCGVVQYEEGRGYSFVTETEAGGTYCRHHTSDEVRAAALRRGTGTIGAEGYNADEQKESTNGSTSASL